MSVGAWAQSVPPPPKPRVLIILDTSRSMTQLPVFAVPSDVGVSVPPVNGAGLGDSAGGGDYDPNIDNACRSKFCMAKKAVNNVLPNFTPDARIGLTTYYQYTLRADSLNTQYTTCSYDVIGPPNVITSFSSYADYTGSLLTSCPSRYSVGDPLDGGYWVIAGVDAGHFGGAGADDATCVPGITRTTAAYYPDNKYNCKRPAGWVSPSSSNPVVNAPCDAGQMNCYVLTKTSAQADYPYDCPIFTWPVPSLPRTFMYRYDDAGVYVANSGVARNYIDDYLAGTALPVGGTWLYGCYDGIEFNQIVPGSTIVYRPSGPPTEQVVDWTTVSCPAGVVPSTTPAAPPSLRLEATPVVGNAVGNWRNFARPYYPPNTYTYSENCSESTPCDFFSYSSTPVERYSPRAWYAFFSDTTDAGVFTPDPTTLSLGGTYEFQQWNDGPGAPYMSATPAMRGFVNQTETTPCLDEGRYTSGTLKTTFGVPNPQAGLDSSPIGRGGRADDTHGRSGTDYACSPEWPCDMIWGPGSNVVTPGAWTSIRTIYNPVLINANQQALPLTPDTWTIRLMSPNTACPSLSGAATIAGWAPNTDYVWSNPAGTTTGATVTPGGCTGVDQGDCNFSLNAGSPFTQTASATICPTNVFQKPGLLPAPNPCPFNGKAYTGPVITPTPVTKRIPDPAPLTTPVTCATGTFDALSGQGYTGCAKFPCEITYVNMTAGPTESSTWQNSYLYIPLGFTGTPAREVEQPATVWGVRNPLGAASCPAGNGTRIESNDPTLCPGGVTPCTLQVEGVHQRDPFVGANCSIGQCCGPEGYDICYACEYKQYKFQWDRPTFVCNYTSNTYTYTVDQTAPACTYTRQRWDLQQQGAGTRTCVYDIGARRYDFATPGEKVCQYWSLRTTLRSQHMYYTYEYKSKGTELIGRVDKVTQGSALCGVNGAGSYSGALQTACPEVADCSTLGTLSNPTLYANPPPAGSTCKLKYGAGDRNNYSYGDIGGYVSFVGAGGVACGAGACVVGDSCYSPSMNWCRIGSAPLSPNQVSGLPFTNMHRMGRYSERSYQWTSTSGPYDYSVYQCATSCTCGTTCTCTYASCCSVYGATYPYYCWSSVNYYSLSNKYFYPWPYYQCEEDPTVVPASPDDYVEARPTDPLKVPGFCRNGGLPSRSYWWLISDYYSPSTPNTLSMYTASASCSPIPPQAGPPPQPGKPCFITDTATPPYQLVEWSNTDYKQQGFGALAPTSTSPAWSGSVAAVPSGQIPPSPIFVPIPDDSVYDPVTQRNALKAATGLCVMPRADLSPADGVEDGPNADGSLRGGACIADFADKSVPAADFTPLYGALKNAADYFQNRFDDDMISDPGAGECRGYFVILATDGLEQTPASYSLLGSDPSSSVQGLVGAMRDLSATTPRTRPDIQTFVIGFGEGTAGAGVGALNQIAATGGTTAAYFTSSLADLEMALNSVFTIITAGAYSRTKPAIGTDGTRIYHAGFIRPNTGPDWSGLLTAYGIDPATGFTYPKWVLQDKLNDSAHPARDIKAVVKDGLRVNASDFLASNSRLKLGGTGADVDNQLDSRWDYASSLPDGGSPNPDDLIAFLRQKNEPYDRMTAGVIVRRGSALAPIVSSSPIVVGRSPFDDSYGGTSATAQANFRTFIDDTLNRGTRIYFAANDGMIHAINEQDAADTDCLASEAGIDCVNGTEAWAAIPMMLPLGEVASHGQPRLGQSLFKLKSTGAWSDMLLNGTVAVADVCNEASDFTGDAANCLDSDWKTVLLGCQREGGRGVFAIDITEHEAPDGDGPGSGFLWHFEDAYLGFTYSTPAIGRVTESSKDRFVAVLGAGVDDPVSSIVEGHKVYVLDALQAHPEGDGVPAAGRAKVVAEYTQFNQGGTPMDFPGDIVARPATHRRPGSPYMDSAWVASGQSLHVLRFAKPSGDQWNATSNWQAEEFFNPADPTRSVTRATNPLENAPVNRVIMTYAGNPADPNDPPRFGITPDPDSPTLPLLAAPLGPHAVVSPPPSILNRPKIANILVSNGSRPDIFVGTGDIFDPQVPRLEFQDANYFYALHDFNTQGHSTVDDGLAMWVAKFCGDNSVTVPPALPPSCVGMGRSEQVVSEPVIISTCVIVATYTPPAGAHRCGMSGDTTLYGFKAASGELADCLTFPSSTPWGGTATSVVRLENVGIPSDLIVINDSLYFATSQGGLGQVGVKQRPRGGQVRSYRRLK